MEQELRVYLTFREIFDRVHNSMDFDRIGVNEWCLNEGLADKDDTKDLTWEKAQVFMKEEEFKARAK